MKKLYLPKNIFALVDDSDLESLSVYKWSLAKGYVCRGYRTKEDYKKQKIEYLHRRIMQAKKGEEVDHINGDKLDNRRENLRICSHQENQRNVKCHIDNKSKFKGVMHRPKLSKSRPWQARLRFDGKEKHIGLYSTPQEAAAAYNESASKYFGKFAKLNSI